MQGTKRWSRVLGFGVVLAAACAAQNGTPLAVRTGEWESTITTTRSGAPPIPPEVLARMTPEQRARMEERMKARAAQGPQTHVTKTCLTKEDLAKGFTGDESQKTCKRTILSSSSRSQDFKVECDFEGMVSTGTGRVEATDSTHMNAKVKINTTVGGRTSTTDMAISAKWLGAVCTDSKKE